MFIIRMRFEDFVGFTFPFNRSTRLWNYAKQKTTCFRHTFMIVYDKTDELQKALAKMVAGSWAKNDEFPYHFFTYGEAASFCQMIDEENKNRDCIYYNHFITTQP